MDMMEHAYPGLQAAAAQASPAGGFVEQSLLMDDLSDGLLKIAQGMLGEDLRGTEGEQDLPDARTTYSTIVQCQWDHLAAACVLAVCLKQQLHACLTPVLSR
jgi:hypothetical protein